MLEVSSPRQGSGHRTSACLSNSPLPAPSSFFQTKSEFTVEFSVSDHQGVSDSSGPCSPGRTVPGPRGVGWGGWGKKPVASANSNSPPFSCQVITRKVNIQVGDVNDNAPTFHNQPYSVRIPEVGAPDLHLGDTGDLLLPSRLGVE